MDFPKRTKQQKNEAHSYAILLYKLRDLGIFRNLTGNDYGIDFELELVGQEQVTARTVKIQVKSSEKLKLRRDKTVSVGGIKQSTLAYWCEWSFRTNVIAYAVDLDSETIYVSNRLFWQATKAIDGGKASKSISFLPSGEDGDRTAKALTLIGALAPTAADQVYAHTLALRRLKEFLALLADRNTFDPSTPVHEPDHFRDLLDAARHLLWLAGSGLWADPNDREYWQEYSYWELKSQQLGADELSYDGIRPALEMLVPELAKELRKRREWVLEGKYYWAHRNPGFLHRVFETAVPEGDRLNDLVAWYDDYETNAAKGGQDAAYFIAEAKVQTTPTRSSGKTSRAFAPRRQPSAKS
ncbi:MAG TPA: DUF4365 domain-containing protein [Allosphingosinicella sp.]|jgi:hypothetical protein